MTSLPKLSATLRSARTWTAIATLSLSAAAAIAIACATPEPTTAAITQTPTLSATELKRNSDIKVACRNYQYALEASVRGDANAVASHLLQGYREAVWSRDGELIRASEAIQSDDQSAATAGLLEVYDICGIFGESGIDEINEDPNVLTLAQGTLSTDPGKQESSRQLLSEVNDFYVQFDFHSPDSSPWDFAIEVGGTTYGYQIIIDSDGRATLRPKSRGPQFTPSSALLSSTFHISRILNTFSVSVIAGRATIFLNGLYAGHFDLPTGVQVGPVALVAGLTNDSTYKFEYSNLNALEVSDMIVPDSGPIDPIPGDIGNVTYDLQPISQGNVRYVGAYLSPVDDITPWSNGFVFLDSPESALFLTVDDSSNWWLHYIEDGEWYAMASGYDSAIHVKPPVRNKVELTYDFQLEFCLLVVGFVNASLLFDLSFCQGETNVRNWSDDSDDRFEFVPAGVTGNVGVVANIFDGDASLRATYNNFIIKGLGKYE